MSDQCAGIHKPHSQAPRSSVSSDLLQSFFSNATGHALGTGQEAGHSTVLHTGWEVTPERAAGVDEAQCLTLTRFLQPSTEFQKGTWGYGTEPNHLLKLNPSFCRDQYQPTHSPHEWSLHLILLPKHKELSSVSHWARKWGSFNSLCLCRKCFCADGKSTSTHNPRQASKNDEDNILLAANTKN